MLYTVASSDETTKASAMSLPQSPPSTPAVSSEPAEANSAQCLPPETPKEAPKEAPKVAAKETYEIKAHSGITGEKSQKSGDTRDNFRVDLYEEPATAPSDGKQKPPAEKAPARKAA